MLSGVVIASKKIVREVMSMYGVPVMPMSVESTRPPGGFFVAYGPSAPMFQVVGSFHVGNTDARLSALTPDEKESTVPRTFCPKLPEYGVCR